MPTSDQSGFDRAPPDLTKQADFDAASMQLASDVAEHMAQNVRSVAEATSVMSKGLEKMAQMSQSAAENGLSLDGVLDKQRALVLKVSEAVSKSNLSYEDQAKLQKTLVGGIQSYAQQMSRIVAIKRKELESLRKGTPEYKKQEAALRKTTEAAKSYQSVLDAVKAAERRAQRSGASKKMGGFPSRLGNYSDAAAKDTSGLSGWWNSKRESSKKDILHQSGAWKGNGWGTLDTGKLEKNWKTVGATIGVAAVAAGKALGNLAKQYESAAVGLALYKNSVEQAARAMGMMDAKPLEALRSSLDMTRNQASQLFQVMDQGMSATGKSAAELSNVAEALKATFGGDITSQLKTYVELMKAIPTLQEDLTSGSSDDQTAALYGLAKSGKAGDLNALMPTGLFGGEQQRQPGADKLDAAQSASAMTERLGDFLMGLMPTWSSYFAEIPGLVSSFGSIASVIPVVAGAIEASVLVTGARRAAQADANARDTEDAINSNIEATEKVSSDLDTVISNLQSQNASSQSDIESAIINSSGGQKIEAQIKKAIPKIPKIRGRGLPPSRIDVNKLGLGKFQKIDLKALGLDKLFGKGGGNSLLSGVKGLLGKGGGGLGGAGMRAGAALGIWQLSQKGAGLLHERAKKDLANGDLRSAKANLFASTATSFAGGAAAGAVAGSQFGGYGAAIGAAVGALGGLAKAALDLQDTWRKIRAEEKENIKEFGTAIVPLTQGKADFDKAMKMSSGLVRAHAQSQANAARILQNALGELSSGVNNAKIQFYQLQKELAGLRISRFQKYGAPTGQSALNAMNMGLTAARNTFDTKMGAVNRARARAQNDPNLTPEARNALLTQAAREEEVALNELMDSTLAASQALAGMPEYLAAAISGDAINAALTKGLVNTADLNSVFKSGVDAWRTNVEKINAVTDANIKGLQDAEQKANQTASSNIKSAIENLSGATKEDTLSPERRAELEKERERLVAENAKIKADSTGQGMTGDEQSARDEARKNGGANNTKSWWRRNTGQGSISRLLGGGRIGKAVEARLAGTGVGALYNAGLHHFYFKGEDKAKITANNRRLEEIDKELSTKDANATASSYKVELNEKYGANMRDVLKSDGTIDQAKAASVVSDLQAEAAMLRQQLGNMANGNDIVNIRSIDTNRKQRKSLEEQKYKLMGEGKTEEAAKVQSQIEALNAKFADTLKPSLDRLFEGTKMNDDQKQKAAEFVEKEGLDKFVSVLNSGKSASIFGGKEVSKDIVTALKNKANNFAEANKTATKLGVVEQLLNTFSSQTVDNFGEILKREQERSTKTAEENERVINWLKAISSGIDTQTVELRHAAKLANVSATLAGVGGDGTKEAGEALAAEIKAYGASTDAAAKAIEELPLILAGLEAQKAEAQNRKESAQKDLTALEDRYNKEFGGKSEEQMSKDEKERAQTMRDAISKAKSRVDVATQDVSMRNKDIAEAKESGINAKETLANNARAQVNFMQTMAQQIQKGMESTKGLLSKALSEAAATAFESATFSDNIAEGASVAREIAIDAANRQAEIEIKAAEETFKNAEAQAKEAGKAVAAAMLAEVGANAKQKALDSGASDEEAEKMAEAAKAAAKSAADAAAFAAEVDVMEQARVKYTQQVTQSELDKRKKTLESIKHEADLRRKTVELQQQAVEEMRDFAENYGGSFAEVLQLQNMSVQLEREKLEIAKNELAQAEAKGASGQVLLEARQKVLMQEIALRKKEIGVAKSMMDRMLGAAFGQIRQSFGARVQMGTAQHLMGTENTRIKRADGTYMAGDPKTIEQRQFERQVNGAFGGSPDVLSGVGNGESPDKNGTEMAAKVMHESADKQMDAANLQYKAAELFNQIISGNKNLGQYTTGANRNAETQLWNSATGTGARTMGDGNPPSVEAARKIVGRTAQERKARAEEIGVAAAEAEEENARKFIAQNNARQEAANAAMLWDNKVASKTAGVSAGSRSVGGATSSVRSIAGGGSTGVTKQTLGGPVQNGFVGYNGDIRSFQGAKGMSASALVRGRNGKLYTYGGNRADARSMFVGGREGKMLTGFGSNERVEKQATKGKSVIDAIKRDTIKNSKWAGRSIMSARGGKWDTYKGSNYQGIKNAEELRDGMNKGQKAHKNEWKGVSSGHENSPGVAAQGAGGGSGGGGLSGKVSGSVELNINPEIFKETVAPIVMDVILNNVNTISTLLMG